MLYKLLYTDITKYIPKWGHTGTVFVKKDWICKCMPGGIPGACACIFQTLSYIRFLWGTIPPTTNNNAHKFEYLYSPPQAEPVSNGRRYPKYTCCLQHKGNKQVHKEHLGSSAHCHTAHVRNVLSYPHCTHGNLISMVCLDT